MGTRDRSLTSWSRPRIRTRRGWSLLYMGCRRARVRVEVVAVNEEHQSSPSTRVRLSMSKRLGDIELQETGEDFLIISWSSDGHYRYNVSYISDKQKA